MRMKVIWAKVKQGGVLQFHILPFALLFFSSSSLEAGGCLFGTLVDEKMSENSIYDSK